MNEKFGIENTVAVLRFGLSIQTAIGRAKADGTVNWMDAGHLIPVVQTASNAINGVKFIKDEILDLNDEEQLQLETVAKEYFPDTVDEGLKEKIIETIHWVLDGVQLGTIWFAVQPLA